MKRLLHLINEVGLAKLLSGLTMTVLLFALGYWWLARHGQLIFTFETTDRIGFGDALYFSIVTISSLGYGDIRPTGWARALVGAEVIVGLAFLGLLVAKISSVKQDYILRRMYSEAVDEKLVRFATDLADARSLYRTTSALLIAGEMDPELTTTFRRSTPGATFFTQFRQLMNDLRVFVVGEAYNNAIFGEVPDSHIEVVYDNIRGVLRRTAVLWQKNAEDACRFVLCDNGEDLAGILDHAEALAILGKRESRNADIAATCSAILELVTELRRDVLPAL